MSTIPGLKLKIVPPDPFAAFAVSWNQSAPPRVGQVIALPCVRDCKAHDFDAADETQRGRYLVTMVDDVADERGLHIRGLFAVSVLRYLGDAMP